MKLLDIAKENQELLNDGIMSLVVYKQGRSWKYKELYCCEYTEGEGFEWDFDDEEEHQEVLNIMEIDSNAIIINGYDSAFAQGSVKKICDGLRYAYENNWGLLSSEKESILNGEIAPLKSSNLDIKSEPTEEDIKSSLIADLISDKDNYRNEDKKCLCSKCEIKGMCNYVNLRREQGDLGFCHKLNDFTFYSFVESHLEKYKLIVDTRRKKRNYIEVELLSILQKFDDKIVATSYKINCNEEYLKIQYTDNKSVKLCITATNLDGIKKLVCKEILKLDNYIDIKLGSEKNV